MRGGGRCGVAHRGVHAGVELKVSGGTMVAGLALPCPTGEGLRAPRRAVHITPHECMTHMTLQVSAAPHTQTTP